MRIFILLFLLFSATYQVSGNIPELEWVKKVGAKTKPKELKQFHVQDYGAVNDGTTLNTKAIQKAIDACASRGGGTVTFDKGKYLTGAIFLKKGVHFILPKGTTLLGSTDLKDYPDIDTRVAGIEMKWPAALVNVLDQENVKISGDGVVHGQGKVFWDKYWSMRKEYEKKGLRWIVDYDCKRPRTLLVSGSKNITVEDITIQQAGFWSLHILYSEHCTVNGVIIQNNVAGKGPSTDGIDIDSSSYVLVENCDIDCNDDNFCLKAGRDADGLRVGRPTEYIVIRNSISRAGSGLFTCGSETSGNIRYVLAENMKAEGTKTGIRLKSAMNRGGKVEHIYVQNIEMNNVGTAFETGANWNPAYSYSSLPKEYEGKKLPDHWKKMLENVDKKSGIPYFENIYLNNIKVTNGNTLMTVDGNSDSVMKKFFIDNIDADVHNAGYVTYAEDWKVNNIRIKSIEQPEIKVSDSKNVNFTYPQYEKKFTYKLNGISQESYTAISEDASALFCYPEIAGNIEFGVISGEKSKWVKDFEVKKTVSKDNRSLSFHFSDPILSKGLIKIDIITLSDSNGTIIKLYAENIPKEARLVWAYGGASAKMPQNNSLEFLKPIDCANNIFSVEGTAFTTYYGESMKLKTLNIVTPPESDIRISDSFYQDSPALLLNSGKKTKAPLLTADLLLENSKDNYFCLYKQNDKADYNYYMLPALFEKESKK